MAEKLEGWNQGIPTPFERVEILCRNKKNHKYITGKAYYSIYTHCWMYVFRNGKIGRVKSRVLGWRKINE